ncbi:MAG: prolyl oligopeptidase family serine peptidase, partial [Phycisphaerales bacterium]
VQYYAVTPILPGEQTGNRALVLTLHGAGVQARRQAAVYTPKTWANIVAPTNRRPYGFDWEDWGRLDALEVLDLAMRRYRTDPDRVFLTGHSMGGHGVWHLGVTFPDRFAAIGPSAGWSSFFTYAGGTAFAADDSIDAILARAQQSSVTRDLARNYLHHGVYILHGGKDDNVPVEQAREMRNILDEFHTDVAYHEQPGAGHWWGDQCCDWGPMFDFFDDHVRSSLRQLDRIEFLTANPGISASSRWACIESQVKPLALSGIEIELDRARRHFQINTTNVASLRIDPDAIEPGAPVHVTIDGQALGGPTWIADQPMRLVRLGSRWSISNAPASADRKGPQRYGPFKDAFRRHARLVYGTAGSPDENAWAYRKARYDAETFWYRGNGAFDVVADCDFDFDADVDHNVILYGNADTNRAWASLLADSPVRVDRDGVVIAASRLAGDDLACLFIRPRPGSSVACVGVVSGTGPPGRRLVEQLPYFVSGVHYPDCIVIGPEMLTDDTRDGVAGIRAAGIFGPDWSVENGDFAWRN